jgi:ABC-2 type transport system ATP-binding protein
VIETHALGKRFGDKLALDGLTLRVEPGEVMGFLGPNGSGKTTTIRILMGLLRPSAGRASILGRDCQVDSTELKREVGYLPEEPFLYPYLTGRELLEFVAGLHGFSRGEAQRRAAAALERFGLAAERNAFAITYSLGMRKRLALAAALIHDPQVLVLDEPTNGLDPQGARQMRELMSALATAGKTVFVSTHLLDAAEKLCRRVAVIGEGRLRACGTPAELRAQFGIPAQSSLEELFLALTAAPTDR